MVEELWNAEKFMMNQIKLKFSYHSKLNTHIYNHVYLENTFWICSIFTGSSHIWDWC